MGNPAHGEAACVRYGNFSQWREVSSRERSSRRGGNSSVDNGVGRDFEWRRASSSGVSERRGTAETTGVGTQCGLERQVDATARGEDPLTWPLLVYPQAKI